MHLPTTETAGSGHEKLWGDSWGMHDCAFESGNAGIDPAANESILR